MDARVRIFQALADETRLQIVLKLKQCNEACCSELSKEFDLTRPALSYHFRTLREAGVIKVQRKGQYKYCSLNRVKVNQYLPGLFKII